MDISDPALTAIHINTSESLQLICTLLAGNPASGPLIWYLNGTMLTEPGKSIREGFRLSADNYILTMLSPTENKNGVYTCLVYNGVKQPTCQQPYYFNSKYAG